ncbi:MAG: hypothetical protein LIP00_02880 [Parabacteroides sp.]|nr:hypothetical protein [Parabacteroides sp.]
MFDFLMPPLVIGLICAGIYGLFELFVRRPERMALIEKLGDKLGTPELRSKSYLPRYGGLCFSFSALKGGLLMTGIGLGLLVGFFIMTNTVPNYPNNEHWGAMDRLGSIVYGASVLLFGGIGLIVAFVIEMKLSSKKNDD